MTNCKTNKTSYKKGHKQSEEVRKKMSLSRMGKAPWNKGKEMSDITKRKLSESHKGQIAWNKGKKGLQTAWNKGMKMSEEHKKKLSIIRKEKPNRYWLGKKRPKLDLSNRIMPKGKEHHNWKGGITSISEKLRKSTEYKTWRELVFEKNDWTCQKCLQRGGDIHAHHIIGFSDNEELRFNTDNGITLCKNCHYAFHTKYGFTNNNHNQLQEFINSCEASGSRE